MSNVWLLTAPPQATNLEYVADRSCLMLNVGDRVLLFPPCSMLLSLFEPRLQRERGVRSCFRLDYRQSRRSVLPPNTFEASET
jgi:hypothetical protein